MPEYCVDIKILRYFILLDPCVNLGRRVEIFLRRVRKISNIKTWRNNFFCEEWSYSVLAEETKTALADINMYHWWRSTSKDKQIRVNEGYREKQNNAVKRSQHKERENTNSNKDNVTSSAKRK